MSVSPADRERIKSARALIIVVMGFGAGILSGLLGIGGGSVLVPVMVYLLGMSQHRAHGTSLAVISATVVISSLIYGRGGFIDWPVAVELAVGGVVGGVIGARVACVTKAGRLRLYFGVFLGLIGLWMLWGSGLAADGSGAAVGSVPGHGFGGFLGGAVMVVTGLITGILSGLLGIGGGIVMIPALVLLLGFEQKFAQGISLAVIIPVSVAGSLVHAAHGNVRWEAAFWLALGGVIGGLVGANFAMGTHSLVLKGLFGVLMLLTGALMAFRKSEKC